jgi:hypothetical protein
MIADNARVPALIAVSLIAQLLLASAAVAQAPPVQQTTRAVPIVVAPIEVDASAPGEIVITPDAAADPDVLKRVDHATVDGESVEVRRSGATFVLTPPPLGPGLKVLQLRDAAEAVLAETQIEFRGAPAAPTEERRQVIAQSNWFYALVTLLFAAIVVPFSFGIVATVWRGSAGASAMGQPLGLPEGTVRAVLAFLLVAYLGFYVLASVLSVSEFKPPEFLSGIVATVIGFYFGTRSNGPSGATTTTAGTITSATTVSTGRVAGTVVDSTGAPVAKATVMLSDAARPTIPAAMVETAVDGSYMLEAIEPGAYTLVARRGDVVSESVSVAVEANRTARLEVALSA